MGRLFNRGIATGVVEMQIDAPGLNNRQQKSHPPPLHWKHLGSLAS
jgi:hypothetical protein